MQEMNQTGNEMREAEIKVTPLTVRKAQNAPERVGSGYAYTELAYTTSS